MLSKAQEEAAEWKRQQIEQARHEVEEMETRWRRALEREKQSFLSDLRRRAGEEVYYVTRKALSDLAGEELERRMADVFMQRLRHIPAEEWKQIALAARRAGDQAIVTSAFPLDADMQIRIRNVIEGQLEKHGAEPEPGEDREGVKIIFQQSPDLISGIELIAGGRRAAWSLENYLESLEENITQAFKLNGGATAAESTGTSEKPAAP
jgi:F-type H+-transporting ATPase subunit b